jgi:hypothetical protein
MCDFLEHLPDYKAVKEVIQIAGESATDFIYIRHPSFEDEAYLRAIGLKQYWQDWSGHPSHLLLADLAEMLTDAGVKSLDIKFVKPIWDSTDSTILPIGAPKNQSHYDDKLHGSKALVKFAKPVHRAIYITAYLQ